MNNLTHLTPEQLNEELTKRKASVAEVERVIESRKEWPQHKDKYFFIDEKGEVEEGIWYGGFQSDTGRRTFLGIYRDQASAQIVLELVKVLVPSERFVPKEGEVYWMWDTLTRGVTWVNDCSDRLWLVQGNCFPYTDEGKAQCEAYGIALTKAAEMILKV